jgi:hypothetical protein
MNNDLDDLHRDNYRIITSQNIQAGYFSPLGPIPHEEKQKNYVH